MALEVKLSRADRRYQPPDVIDGHVIVNTPSRISHHGIKITIVGTVILQPRVQSIGIIESIYKSIQPIQLLYKTVQIGSPGKIDPGNREIPFHISLDGLKGSAFGVLYDTYHGASIRIEYLLTAEISRSYIQRTLSATVEFIVESSKGLIPRPPVHHDSAYFYITQDTQKHSLLPLIRSGGFRVIGRVATSCILSEPVLGEITVEFSAVPIRSIDINLLRSESVALSDRIITDTTEIQSTQVTDGDVCRGLSLPIYLILPRLLTCPTINSRFFSLEFELSITITFEAEISKLYSPSDSTTTKEWVAFERLPLRLLR